jgi:hypothetical protein
MYCSSEGGRIDPRGLGTQLFSAAPPSALAHYDASSLNSCNYVPGVNDSIFSSLGWVNNGSVRRSVLLTTGEQT